MVMSKFAHVPIEAMSAGLTPVEYFVYTGYLSYRNNKTGRAWPSRVKIAVRLGMAERALEKHTQNLRKKGWLIPLNHPKVGRTAEYRVMLPSEVLQRDDVPLEDVELQRDVVPEALNEVINVETGECYTLRGEEVHREGSRGTPSEVKELQRDVVPELTSNRPITYQEHTNGADAPEEDKKFELWELRQLASKHGRQGVKADPKAVRDINNMKNPSEEDKLGAFDKYTNPSTRKTSLEDDLSDTAWAQ